MRPRLTCTDGYKFSMAEAGAVLRSETFYYCHRRGGCAGWHYLPVDINKFVQNLLPQPSVKDYEYLGTHGYDLGAAYKKAMACMDQIRIDAIPKGSWFYSREPVFSITGPSAVVSWFEPTILQLSYRIQVATLALTNWAELAKKVAKVTCRAEKDLICEILDELNIRTPPIKICTNKYQDNIYQRAKKLIKIVRDPNRIFEVGMRAVSCSAQHYRALESIRRAGILRTSNVDAASILDMIPVGTMGHEHVQRYGDDYELS
jgi:nicotinic acid phosphoribosyltransferase